MDKKVIGIGMSGGVDSSAAAYLLKSQGYDVIGITMHLIDNQKSIDSINDAKNVFAWYEISANQGNREAQHHLGDFYKWGWDPVASDTLKAINWYQKAANQNDTLALFKMGELWYYKNL